MGEVGPGGADMGLNGGQRDHFPGDLGKAFGAPDNGDKAHLVNIDNITRIIPAIFNALQNAWLIGQQDSPA